VFGDPFDRTRSCCHSAHERIIKSHRSGTRKLSSEEFVSAMRGMTAGDSWREWQWGLPGASLGISAGRRPLVAAGAKGRIRAFQEHHRVRRHGARPGVVGVIANSLGTAPSIGSRRGGQACLSKGALRTSLYTAGACQWGCALTDHSARRVSPVSRCARRGSPSPQLRNHPQQLGSFLSAS
jgi:hypothetical protein